MFPSFLAFFLVFRALRYFHHIFLLFSPQFRGLAICLPHPQVGVMEKCTFSLSLPPIPCHPPAPLITGMLPRAEVVAREDALCFVGSCCRH